MKRMIHKFAEQWTLRIVRTEDLIENLFQLVDVGVRIKGIEPHL
jgi:hypothetical protein